MNAKSFPVTERVLASMREDYRRTRPRPTTVERQHIDAINAIDRHNPGDRHRLAGRANAGRLAQVIREVIA